MLRCYILPISRFILHTLIYHFKTFRLNIPVKEISVNWKEIEGSKLNVLTASLSFFRDYFAMIVFYTTGFWDLGMQ
jgi:hypothetical protein